MNQILPGVDKTCKQPEVGGVGEKKGKAKRHLQSPGERQGIHD